MDYTKYFEHKQRVNGEYFYCLTDDTPEEMKDLMYKIHDHGNFNDCLPNDWIFEIAYFAFDELSRENLDNIYINPDCYNRDLKNWLLNPFAENFIDEVLQNYGEQESFMSLIMEAQRNAKYEIYYLINEWLDERERHEDE